MDHFESPRRSVNQAQQQAQASPITPVRQLVPVTGYGGQPAPPSAGTAGSATPQAQHKPPLPKSPASAMAGASPSRSASSKGAGPGAGGAAGPSASSPRQAQAPPSHADSPRKSDPPTFFPSPSSSSSSSTDSLTSMGGPSGSASKAKRVAEDEGPGLPSPAHPAAAPSPAKRPESPATPAPPPSPAAALGAGQPPMTPAATPAALQQRFSQLGGYLHTGDVVCLVSDRGLPMAVRPAPGAQPSGSLSGAAPPQELADNLDVLEGGVAVGSAQHVSRVECQLEVFKLQDGPYVGFRAVVANGRFLQARRKGPSRLMFYNVFFGVHEQWGVADFRTVRVPGHGSISQGSPSKAQPPDASPSPPGAPGPSWEAAVVTLVPRQLPAFELKCVIYRCPAHLRHRPAPLTAPPSRQRSPLVGPTPESGTQPPAWAPPGSAAAGITAPHNPGTEDETPARPHRLHFDARPEGAPRPEPSLNPSPDHASTSSETPAGGAGQPLPQRAASQEGYRARGETPAGEAPYPGSAAPASVGRRWAPSSAVPVFPPLASMEASVRAETERLLGGLVDRFASASAAPHSQAAPAVHQLITGSMMNRWGEFVAQEVDVLRHLSKWIGRLSEEAAIAKVTAREELRLEAERTRVEIVEISREVTNYSQDVLRRSQEVLHSTFGRLVKHFIARGRTRLMRRCFRAWSEYAAHRAEIRTVRASELAAARDLDLLTQALRCWAATAAELRDLRRGIEQIKKRRALGLVRRCLQGWRYVSSCRNAGVRLLQALQRRSHFATMALAFSALRDNAGFLRASRAVAEARGAARARGLLAASFGSWRQVTEHLSAARLAVEETAADRVALSAKEAFYAWAETTFETQARRIDIMAVAEEAMGRRRLAGSFSRWRSSADRARRGRRVATTLEGKRSRRLLLGCLREWTGMASRGKHLRKLLANCYRRINNSVLRTVWTTWTLHAMEERRARALDDRACAFFARVQLRRALTGWAAASAERRLLRHLLKVTLKRKAHSVMVRLLRMWRQYAVDRRRLQVGVSGFRKTRLLLAAFQGWKGFVVSERRGKYLEAKARRVVSIMTSSRVFSTWHRWARRRVLLRMAASRMAARGTDDLRRRIFREWLATTRLRLDTLVSLRARREVRVRQAARDCLSAWAGLAREAAQRRAVGQGLLSRSLGRHLLASAFGAWVDVCGVRGRAVREAAAAGFYRALWFKRRRHYLSTALAAWTEVIALRARQERALVRAYAHNRARLLTLSFKVWADHVKFAAKRRQMIGACELRKKVSAQWFLGWYWDAFSQEIDWTLRTLYDGCGATMRRLDSLDRQLLAGDAPPRGMGPEKGAAGAAEPSLSSPLNESLLTPGGVEERLAKAADRVKWYSGLSMLGALSPAEEQARPKAAAAPVGPIGSLSLREALGPPMQDVFRELGLSTPLGAHPQSPSASPRTVGRDRQAAPLAQSPIENRIFAAMAAALPPGSPLLKAAAQSRSAVATAAVRVSTAAASVSAERASSSTVSYSSVKASHESREVAGAVAARRLHVADQDSGHLQH